MKFKLLISCVGAWWKKYVSKCCQSCTIQHKPGILSSTNKNTRTEIFLKCKHQKNSQQGFNFTLWRLGNLFPQEYISLGFCRKITSQLTSLLKIWSLLHWGRAKTQSENSELLRHVESIHLTPESLFVMKNKCRDKTFVLALFEGFGSLNWRILMKMKPKTRKLTKIAVICRILVLCSLCSTVLFMCFCFRCMQQTSLIK